MADDREKIAVLEERVTNWMESTTQYRKDLCAKIDHIATKMDNLPCDKRIGWWQSMNKQMNFIWGILFVVVTALITMGVKAVFAK
jgi:hypothetical protein